MGQHRSRNMGEHRLTEANRGQFAPVGSIWNPGGPIGSLGGLQGMLALHGSLKGL